MPETLISSDARRKGRAGRVDKKRYPSMRCGIMSLPPGVYAAGIL